MKGVRPQALISRVKAASTALIQQRFFSDRLSWSILGPTLFLNVLTFVILLIRLHPSDGLIPVHYSSLYGYDQLGPWYQTYNIALFSLGVTAVNTLLASASFSRSRITSFFLLTGSFVVALFCLIISAAFASVT